MSWSYELLWTWWESLLHARTRTFLRIYYKLHISIILLRTCLRIYGITSHGTAFESLFEKISAVVHAHSGPQSVEGAFSTLQDGQTRGSAIHWVMPSHRGIKEPHIAALLRVEAKISARSGSGNRSAPITSGLASPLLIHYKRSRPSDVSCPNRVMKKEDRGKWRTSIEAGLLPG